MQNIYLLLLTCCQLKTVLVFVSVNMAQDLYADLPSNVNIQPFRYLVVLDFEATCDRYKKIYPQEIIEWPAIIIDTQTNEMLMDKIFHFYIKPKHHPKLTPFCQTLTGITQELIDTIGAQNTIQQVIHKWNEWCFNNHLLPYSSDKPNASVITCGDWDLKTMWRYQQQILTDRKLNAALFHSWINIKHVFRNNVYNHHYYNNDKHHGISIKSMLHDLKLKHEGREHSGIDDVKNICKIVIKLLQRNVQFDYTMKQFGKRSIMQDIQIKTNLTRIHQQKILKQKQKSKVIDLTNDDEQDNDGKDNVVEKPQRKRHKVSTCRARSRSRSR